MNRAQIRMAAARMGAAMLAAVSLGASCAGYSEGSAGGEVVSASDAAATVVLHVKNLGTSPVELRSVESGRSTFIGSVGAQDTTSVLLSNLFPTARLFISAIAQAGQRVLIGPLAAGKGDQIDLTVQEGLIGSQANVRR